VIAYLICLLDILFCVPTYTKKKYDHSSRTNKLIWKGICIGIPCLIAVWSIVERFFWGPMEPYMYIIVAGMFCCAVGDIVLEIRFVKGGFLFFFGHLLYVVGLYLYVGRVTTVTLITYLMLVAIGTFLTCDKLGKKYRFYLISYNLMISASFAMGVTLAATNEPIKVLIGVGAMSLVVSDWLLARNKMVGSNFVRSLISLVFYFGGQILISLWTFALQV